MMHHGRTTSRRNQLSMRKRNPTLPVSTEVLNDRAWPRCATGSAGAAATRASSGWRPYFAGHGYDPHRHDAYAVGVTLTGVQQFEYRGAYGAQPPWRGHLVHPDELHDGRAGSEAVCTPHRLHRAAHGQAALE